MSQITNEVSKHHRVGDKVDVKDVYQECFGDWWEDGIDMMYTDTLKNNLKSGKCAKNGDCHNHGAVKETQKLFQVNLGSDTHGCKTHGKVSQHGCQI